MRNVNMLDSVIKLSVLTGILVMALPEGAMAGADVNAVLTKGVTQVSMIPTLLSAAAYIIGLILLISGSLSLKKHSENPASEPLGKGLGRVLVGAAVMSLPSLANLITTSLGTDSGAVTFVKAGNIS